VLRFLGRFLIALLLVGGFVTPVFAIGDPDYVSIGDAYVFRDVIDNGDQLYFVRYDVSYSPVPGEDADETWEVALYDSIGSLVATRPLNYYQHNIISIYLTAAQAITWGSAHQLIIRGNPAVFETLVEGTNQRTRVLGSGDYFEVADLGGIMITQAGILEDDWGITLLTLSDKLNVTGATYFTAAVPGLNSMVPSIFQYGGVVYSQPPFPTPDTAYADTLRGNLGDLGNVGGAVANITGGSAAAANAWIALIGAVVMGSIVVAATNKPEAGVGFGLVSIVGFAWMGLFDFGWVLAVVFLLVIASILIVAPRVS
jgi:hypothetical protein